MRKKLLAILLMSVMAFSVTACGGVLDVAGSLKDDKEENMSNKPQDSVIVDEEEEVVEEDTSLDLDEAITDALEDEGEAVIESEGTLAFAVPEGFVYDDVNQIYNSADGMANIIYSTMENDGSIAYVTQELMETGLESSLTSQFGTELDITFTLWEEITFEGFDAIQYCIEYEVSGISIVQTQVIIGATENLHYLTFTDMSGGEYDDEFAAVIESMKFEK